MLRDISNNLNVLRAISPVSISDNTAAVSQIIDMMGYNALMFAIQAGSLADADATFTALVEHGDTSNLTDAAAVPDSMLNGLESGASFQFDDDNEPRKIGYVGDKRYVRLTITPANNASAALVSAVAIQGLPGVAPVAQ